MDCALEGWSIGETYALLLKGGGCDGDDGGSSGDLETRDGYAARVLCQTDGPWESQWPGPTAPVEPSENHRLLHWSHHGLDRDASRKPRAVAVLAELSGVKLHIPLGIADWVRSDKPWKKILGW